MVYFSLSSFAKKTCTLNPTGKNRKLSSSDRVFYQKKIKIIFENLKQKVENLKKDEEITRKAYLFSKYQKDVEHAIGNSHSKKHEIRQVFDEEYEMFIKKNTHLIEDHEGILIKC